MRELQQSERKRKRKRERERERETTSRSEQRSRHALNIIPAALFVHSLSLSLLFEWMSG